MFESWPFTNFHDINLDWIIRRIKNIETSEANAKASEEAAADSASAAAGSMGLALVYQNRAKDYRDEAQASANSIAGVANQVTVNTAAIDTLVANAGDLTQNSELLNIRVGWDGTTYNTAGDAVRAQAMKFDNTFTDPDLGANAFYTGMEFLRGDHTKNLLPYTEDYLQREDTYVISTNGRLTTLADWTSIAMPISGDVTYSTLGCSGAHISYYSEFPDPHNATIPSILPGYISGTTGNQTGAVTPSNTAWMVVSVPMSRLPNEVQVELGTAATTFEPYTKGLDVSKIINGNIYKTTTVTLTTSGNSEYANLRECLEDLADKANAMNRYEVVLLPGVYDVASMFTEYNNKGMEVPNYVKLVGRSDRDATRIECTLEAQNTQFSPLNFAMWAEMENITVEATNTRYAVHDDFAPIAYLGSNHRRFKNCKFIAHTTGLGSVYGAGHHGGVDWHFDNCYFDASDASSSGSYGRAFSVHNNTSSPGAGVIKFENCRLLNGSETTGADSVITIGYASNSTGGVTDLILEGCEVNGLALTGDDMFKVSGFYLNNSKDIEVPSGSNYDELVNIL